MADEADDENPYDERPPKIQKPNPEVPTNEQEMEDVVSYVNVEGFVFLLFAHNFKNLLTKI